MFYYGIPSERALVDYIDVVCKLFPHKDDRRVLMFATAIQESSFATCKDPTTDRAGEGLFQFDPTIIEDTLNRSGKSLKRKIEEHFDIDFSEVTHKNLNNMPLIQTILTALKYWIVPKPLPRKDDFEGMWNYYKIYFNSVLGATTREKFKKSYELALMMDLKYGGNK